MADYGAWAGLGEALQTGGDAYSRAKKAAADALMRQQQKQLQDSEIGKNNAQTGFYEGKTKYNYGGPTDPAGLPIPTSGPTTPTGAPPGTPALTPTGIPRAIADKMAMQDNAAKNKAKADATKQANGFSRGEAALVGKYFSGADSNRLSSVPNATSLHNALVDLHNAYSAAKSGDPRALSMLKQKAANNDWLRTQLGSVGNNPDNIVPIYAAARRAAATELFKVVNGSNATPSEDAISHNSGQYPDLGMPPEQAQSLFNLTRETQILPAIQGLRKKVELNRDTKTGHWSSSELEKLHRSLVAREAELSGSVHNVPGGNGESIVPVANTGAHPPEMIAKAQKALLDPNAPPAAKTAAKALLGQQ